MLPKLPPISAPGLAAAEHAPPVVIPVATVESSGKKKTIARRLTEAKQTDPHFCLTVRCRLDALLKLRAEIDDGLVWQRLTLSVNNLLIKAMAFAMHSVPNVNVEFGGNELHRFSRVDIAVDSNGGLITPVVRDLGAP